MIYPLPQAEIIDLPMTPSSSFLSYRISCFLNSNADSNRCRQCVIKCRPWTSVFLGLQRSPHLMLPKPLVLQFLRNIIYPPHICILIYLICVTWTLSILSLTVSFSICWSSIRFQRASRTASKSGFCFAPDVFFPSVHLLHKAQIRVQLNNAIMRWEGFVQFSSSWPGLTKGYPAGWRLFVQIYFAVARSS